MALSGAAIPFSWSAADRGAADRGVITTRTGMGRGCGLRCGLDCYVEWWRGSQADSGGKTPTVTDNDFGQFAAPGASSDSGSALPPPPEGPQALPAVPEPIIAVEAVPKKSTWIGRGAALAGAVALVGGGGYFAITAASDSGGAGSPGEAVEQLLEALSAEDLLGAAELVEPSERETIVEAAFDITEELQRLEVLRDDLDLSAISGIDLEFSDVRVRAEMVRTDLAQVYIDQGTFEASYVAADLPFGPLITDRVPADWLDSSGSVRETVAASTVGEFTNPYGFATDAEPFIAVVERDGRWYVSLWYSVAENIRVALGEPLPNRSAMPMTIGASSPDGAVRALVERTEELDLAGIIGTLDPNEAAALYEYSPLFLDDSQRVLDELLEYAQSEGYWWDVHTLDMSVDERGDFATVIIDSLGLHARWPRDGAKGPRR